MAAAAFEGELLATSPSRNYTFGEVALLLEDVNATDVQGKLRTTQGVFAAWDNYARVPPVPVVTYVGTGLSTTLGMTFKKDVQPCDPDGTWTSGGRTQADGDGTVPTQSLRYATDKWAARGADVRTVVVKKGGHLDMLRTASIVNEIVAEAC